MGLLGLASSAYWDLFIYASWITSLVLIWDIAFHLQSSAFKATGHSKWRWLLLAIVTSPILGIPVAVWYLVAVRSDVEEADAENVQARAERKRARAAARAEGQAEQRRTAQSQPRTGSASYSPPDYLQVGREVNCSGCNGTGKERCYTCGDSRYIPNPSQPGSALQCPRCHSSNGLTCQGCYGSGKMKAY